MSFDQQMAALKSANKIRVRRAEVRRAISSLPHGESRRRAAGVLFDPEPACEGMTAYHLLVSCRQLGPQTATNILLRAGVAQHKRLADMTDRQRDALAGVLTRGIRTSPTPSDSYASLV